MNCGQGLAVPEARETAVLDKVAEKLRCEINRYEHGLGLLINELTAPKPQNESRKEVQTAIPLTLGGAMCEIICRLEGANNRLFEFTDLLRQQVGELKILP